MEGREKKAVDLWKGKMRWVKESDKGNVRGGTERIRN